MCHSPEAWADYRKYVKQHGALISIKDFSPKPKRDQPNLTPFCFLLQIRDAHFRIYSLMRVRRQQLNPASAVRIISKDIFTKDIFAE